MMFLFVLVSLFKASLWASATSYFPVPVVVEHEHQHQHQAFTDFDLAFPFFFALRSLFFNPAIPALQMSAYRTKNASRSAVSTMVENLYLGAWVLLTLESLVPAGFAFCVLPSVARTRTAPLIADSESSVEIRRFWVRYTLPFIR